MTACGIESSSITLSNPKDRKRSSSVTTSDNRLPGSAAYAALCVVAYLDRHISGTAVWSETMAAHLSGLPAAPGVAYDGLGAPPDWNEHLAWQATAAATGGG